MTWRRHPKLFCNLPRPRSCSSCTVSEGLIRQQDRDYKMVVKANIRFVMYMKQRNVPVPSNAELTQRYPLRLYTEQGL